MPIHQRDVHVLMVRSRRDPAIDEWYDICLRDGLPVLLIVADGSRSSVRIDLLPAGVVLTRTGQDEVGAAVQASGAHSFGYGSGSMTRTASAGDFREEAAHELMRRLVEIIKAHTIDPFDRQKAMGQ